MLVLHKQRLTNNLGWNGGMIKYTITNLEYEDTTNGLEKVVKRIHWFAEKSDIFGYGCDFGYQLLDVSDVDAKTFISFERLDQATVIEWLHEAMGIDIVQQVEASINEQYNSGTNADNKGNGTPIRW